MYRNEPQDCLVQNWLRMVKRGNKRQGGDNDLLKTALRRLFLLHGPDGSASKVLLSLGVLMPSWRGPGDSACWVAKGEGTDCVQGQLLSLEEILSIIFFLSGVSGGENSF